MTKHTYSYFLDWCYRVEHREFLVIPETYFEAEVGHTEEL